MDFSSMQLNMSPGELIRDLEEQNSRMMANMARITIENIKDEMAEQDVTDEPGQLIDEDDINMEELGIEFPDFQDEFQINELDSTNAYGRQESIQSARVKEIVEKYPTIKSVMKDKSPLNVPKVVNMTDFKLRLIKSDGLHNMYPFATPKPRFERQDSQKKIDQKVKQTYEVKSVLQ